MTISSKRFLGEIIAALFILLFTYTAISKFYAFDLFKLSLFKSPLLEKHFVLAAWLIPVVELIVSALLFIPFTKRLGMYASFVLMLVFTLYIGFMLVFASELPCSCGGVIQQLGWRQHLVFNLVFAALAAWGIWLLRTNNSNDLLRNKQVGSRNTW